MPPSPPDMTQATLPLDSQSNSPAPVSPAWPASLSVPAAASPPLSPAAGLPGPGSGATLLQGSGAVVTPAAAGAWRSRRLPALCDLAREGPLTMTVRGDCMAPHLHDGDRVEVAPARRYWPGDVVALPTAEGEIALHRLLGYRLLAGRLACVTRGDRCSRPDAPLAPGRLLGRARVMPSLADRLRAVAAFAALALGAAGRRLRG
jgi:hypothetical protein